MTTTEAEAREARVEPCERARELVRELSASGQRAGSGMGTIADLRAREDALLTYIATLERDHRAMERLRATEGRVYTSGAKNVGDTRTTWIADIDGVHRAANDPADAILGGEDG